MCVWFGFLILPFVCGTRPPPLPRTHGVCVFGFFSWPSPLRIRHPPSTPPLYTWCVCFSTLSLVCGPRLPFSLVHICAFCFLCSSLACPSPLSFVPALHLSLVHEACVFASLLVLSFSPLFFPFPAGSRASAGAVHWPPTPVQGSAPHVRSHHRRGLHGRSPQRNAPRYSVCVCVCVCVSVRACSCKFGVVPP